jgi:hypothetical protein
VKHANVEPYSLLCSDARVSHRVGYGVPDDTVLYQESKICHLCTFGRPSHYLGRTLDYLLSNMVQAPECKTGRAYLFDNGMWDWPQDLHHMCETHLSSYTGGELKQTFEDLRDLVRLQNWPTRARNRHICHHIMLCAVKHRMCRDLRVFLNEGYDECAGMLKIFQANLVAAESRLTDTHFSPRVLSPLTSAREAYYHEADWIRRLAYLCDRHMIKMSRSDTLQAMNDIMSRACRLGYVERVRGHYELIHLLSCSVQRVKYEHMLSDFTRKYTRCQVRLNEATNVLQEALQELEESSH